MPYSPAPKATLALALTLLLAAACSGGMGQDHAPVSKAAGGVTSGRLPVMTE